MKNKSVDYEVLRKQLNDYHSTFYGPHSCAGCGKYAVVKKAYEQGGESWEEVNEGDLYIPHHCTHVRVFKRLAGRVLTVIDAAFPPDSPQLKAIKDLLKGEFSSTIASVRELEGDKSAESCETLEQVAGLDYK